MKAMCLYQLRQHVRLMVSGVGLYQFVKVSEHSLLLCILLLDWGKIIDSLKPDLLFTYFKHYAYIYILVVNIYLSNE